MFDEGKKGVLFVFDGRDLVFGVFEGGFDARLEFWLCVALEWSECWNGTEVERWREGWKYCDERLRQM